MTLRFDKHAQRSDTRMSDYSQDIIHLGLEKAAMKKELDAMKHDLSQMRVSYDLVRSMFLKSLDKLSDEQKKELDEKRSTLRIYERNLSEGKNIIDLLEKKKKNLDEILSDKEQNISAAEKMFEGITSMLGNIQHDVTQLDSIRKEKYGKIESINSILKTYEKRLNSLMEKIRSSSEMKIKIDDDISCKRKELSEMNDIISVLQSTNKHGLDMVASFEGERKRLRDKEDALLRKEADLEIYEKRLQKRAEKIGIDLKMTFK